MLISLGFYTGLPASCKVEGDFDFFTNGEVWLGMQFEANGF